LKRTAREQAIIQRRLREYRMLRRNSLASAVDDPSKFSGKFRKRDPFDCGVPQCLCCHREKVFGVPSRQEKIAASAASQQLADLD